MSATPVALPGIFPPPPGVTPNYTNPVVRTYGIIPVGVIFTILSTLFLALRLYTKARIIKIFGWDDIFVTLGWMCTVALTGIWIRSLQIGNGAHLWNMLYDNFREYNIILIASTIISVPAAGLPRVSVLLFYLRLNPGKGFRYSAWTVLAMTWASIIILLGIYIFPCQPVKKLWYPFTEGKCMPHINRVYFATPVIALILDFLIVALPIPMVIRLQVNLRTKLVLMAIFAVSSCTIVTSAVRIYYTSILRGTADNSWNQMLPLSLSLLEYYLEIICVSVMVLRPFCRRHLPFLLGSEGSRRTDDSPGANGALNFDGPSGPNSKSAYRTKVSSTSKTGPMRSGKRSLWSGLGGSTIDDDYEDLESLSTSTELKVQNHQAVNPDSVERVGVTRDDLSAPRGVHRPQDTHNTGASAYGYPLPQESQDGRGILKTVSLDVR